MNRPVPPRTPDDLIANVRAQVQAAQAAAGELRRGSSDAAASAVRSVAARILSEPATIEGYDIIAEHHRGGQGVVYRALQRATRREVALKVLYHAALGGRAGRMRFEREVQILAQLRHPNIVTIHDSAAVGDRCWYAMDFVDGAPLDVWIADRDPIVAAGARSVARAAARAPSTTAPATASNAEWTTDRARNSTSIRDALRLFAKICGAVHAAHVRGVIHRDLKPANILIDHSGEPKVVDFGLAKLTDSSDATQLLDAAMTQAGQFVGSLPWSSPEQAAGEEVDTRSDVYALGVVLFQMLTGQFPYAVSGPAVETLRNIREREPLRPSALRRGVSDDVDTIVRRCLSKERERRYQTAGELGRDIEHYLAGEPIEAKRDSTAYVLRKTLSRHRIPLLVGAAFLAVVAGGAIVSTTGWLRAAQERDRARAAERTAADERDRAKVAEQIAAQERDRAQQAEQAAAAERDRAIAAEQRAAQRFTQLRELAKAFIFDFDKLIENIPGTLSTRKFIVQTALEYLDGAAQDMADDPQLQFELASGYTRIGQLQGSPGFRNLGEYEGALVNFEKARKLFEELYAARPADAEVGRRLAAVYFLIGDMRDAMSDQPGALAAHARHNEICRDLAARENTVLDRLELATGLSTYAMILAKTEGPDGGLPVALDALRRFEALEESPAIPGLPRTRAMAANYVGILYRDKGDLDTALDYFRRSLADHERRVAANPDDIEGQADIAVGLVDVASTLRQMRRFDDAAPIYEQALQIREGVLEREPDNALARRAAAVIHTHLHALQRQRAEATDDRSAALALWKDSRKHAEIGFEYWDDLRATRKLLPQDRAWPGDMRRYLNYCDEQIARLEAETPE